MLSRPWNTRRAHYDFVVVGSGYGGAIAAARLATASVSPRPSICVLERGREWPVGSFPDTDDAIRRERRGPLNPLGLYDLLVFPDISVIKGNGLGGTSLVNANVAIVPDADVFRQTGWPASLTLDTLLPYYDRARRVLAARPHPDAATLLKVRALDRRAREIGSAAFPLNIAVNFTIDGMNEYRAEQKPCIDCGDCITGCNVGAKNTLAMNYLPMAAFAGAEIYTQAEVASRPVETAVRDHCRECRPRRGRDQFHRDSPAIGDARSLAVAEGRLRFQRQRRFLRHRL
jgi:cholesterol oxidase